MQAFSSCGEYKLLSIEVHELLNAVASLVVECRLQACGLDGILYGHGKEENPAICDNTVEP